MNTQSCFKQGKPRDSSNKLPYMAGCIDIDQGKPDELIDEPGRRRFTNEPTCQDSYPHFVVYFSSAMLYTPMHLLAARHSDSQIDRGPRYMS